MEGQWDGIVYDKSQSVNDMLKITK